MANKKTIILSMIVVTATLAILSSGIFSINEITAVAEEVSEEVTEEVAEEVAEEVTEEEYNFAENTRITGIFKFRDGQEISRFEVFTQKQGFQARETFVFELQKVVGSTPLLHKASDDSFHLRNSPSDRQTETEFDVKIVISQDTEQKRAFSYTRCFVSDNSIVTKTDNEEGWTQGKGFAVIDIFEIQCTNMLPLNPVYENMISDDGKANTRSSMDYQSDQ